MLYGRTPPSLLHCIPKTTRIQGVEDALLNRDQILKLLKDHYVRAQSKIKYHADKRRIDINFSVGDLILLKIHPYKQVTVRGATPHKLAAKYYGPFPIAAKIGNVAY